MQTCEHKVVYILLFLSIPVHFPLNYNKKKKLFFQISQMISISVKMLLAIKVRRKERKKISLII